MNLNILAENFRNLTKNSVIDIWLKSWKGTKEITWLFVWFQAARIEEERLQAAYAICVWMPNLLNT